MKNLFSKLVILLVFQIISFHSLGQSRFEDGIVVLNNDDTIFCKINAQRNYKKEYKSASTKLNGKLKKYKPHEISGYGIPGKFHYSSGIIDSTFLEVIVRGKISLYRHKSIYFVKKDTAKSILISNKPVEKNINGRIYQAENTFWRGILKNLLFECSETIQGIDEMEFSEKNLSLIMIEYNKCQDYPFHVFQEDSPSSELEYGFKAGISRQQFRIVDLIGFNNPDLTINEDSIVSNSLQIGLMFNVLFPRINKKFSLQTEILYLEAKNAYTYIIEDDEAKFESNTVFDVSTIVVPISVKYSIPLGRSSIYILTGFTSNFITQSNSFVRNSLVFKQTGQTLSNTIPLNKRFYGNVQFGLGYSYSLKKFKIELETNYHTYIKETISPGGQYSQSIERVTFAITLVRKINKRLSK